MSKYTTIKTAELVGKALDWAVAKHYFGTTEGMEEKDLLLLLTPSYDEEEFTFFVYSPSTNPMQCVAVIEKDDPDFLVDTLRQYVAKNLGDNVEVPQELLEEKEKHKNVVKFTKDLEVKE
jgi:hypothetical protein